jgi:hypothetical protein
MTRGTLGVVAGIVVLGLFVLAGLTQRMRKAEAEAPVEVATVSTDVMLPASATGAAPSAAPAPASPPIAAGAPARKSQLVVAFQLDRKLTQGQYLGDMWVSPPTFQFAQPGDRYVVRARLQTLDASGEPIEVSGDWATRDPGMLAITRLQNGEVQLDIGKPGHTELVVRAAGESKVLQVEARRTVDAMEVAFRQ